jgi:hypothetical protein
MSDYGYVAPYRGMSVAPLPPGFMEAATAPGRYRMAAMAGLGRKAGNIAEQAMTFVEKQKEQEKKDKADLALAKALVKSNYKELGYPSEAAGLNDSTENVKGRASALAAKTQIDQDALQRDFLRQQAESMRLANENRKKTAELDGALQGFVKSMSEGDASVDPFSRMTSALKANPAAAAHPAFPGLLNGMDGFINRSTQKPAGMIPGSVLPSTVEGSDLVATGPNQVQVVNKPKKLGPKPDDVPGYQWVANGNEWQSIRINPQDVAVLGKQQEAVTKKHTKLVEEVEDLRKQVERGAGDKRSGVFDSATKGAKLKSKEAEMQALEAANPWLKSKQEKAAPTELKENYIYRDRTNGMRFKIVGGQAVQIQ